MRMKLLPLRQLSAAAAALLITAGFAQAHPGHSAFDLSSAPHPGHAGEYAALLVVLALTAVGYIGHWVVSRKR